MVCGFSTVAEGHISTVEEQAAEHAILIDPVACILAPRVHQLAAVAGYAELLAVGHGRGEDDVPELSSLVRVDHRRYGRTTQLSFFQKKSYVGEDSV